MGYEVYITRRENWFDEEVHRDISLDEWKCLVADDPEMRMDNFAEATTTGGEFIRVESEGLSVWTKYSQDGINGNHAWFDYYRGTIVVKNPDDEILNKMIDIATLLNAKVQGDEGEIYERGINNEITSKLVDNKINNKELSRKPWWRFW
jgi:hypothetical protein